MSKGPLVRVCLCQRFFPIPRDKSLFFPYPSIKMGDGDYLWEASSKRGPTPLNQGVRPHFEGHSLKRPRKFSQRKRSWSGKATYLSMEHLNS